MNVLFRYSGYLAATQDEETQFHYYFQTATLADPVARAAAPVILWLNGGPGCSSLQGAFNEIGPFVFKTNTAEFYVNPYAWTNFVSFTKYLGQCPLFRIPSKGWLFLW